MTASLVTRALAAAGLALLLVLASAQAQEGPGRKMTDRGRNHVETGTPISYEEYPPTSGPHWPVVAKWAIYSEPVPAEVFVHNLEHGGIVLLYSCAGPCPDVVRQLQELYAALPKSKYGYPKVVVSPNSKIKTRFAVLAWTRLEELERLDRERVRRFVLAWQDKAPEDVP